MAWRGSGPPLERTCGISEHFLAVVADGDLEPLERAMTSVARKAGPGANDPGVCLPDIVEGSDTTTGR